MEARTFKHFNIIFESCEKMPANKKQYMEKLFQFYKYGLKNKEDDIKQKLNKLLFD